MALEWSPVFDTSGLQWSPVFDVSGPAAIVSITAGVDSAVLVYVGPVTHYRLTPHSTGVPGSAVAASGSPQSIPGLDGDAEYTCEVSDDGGATWIDSLDFGTENEGSGGGDIPSAIPLQVAAESDAAIPLLPALQLGIAVESDVAVPLLLVGALQVAEQLDEAVPLVMPGTAVDTAEEADQAMPLLLAIALGVAVEADLAVQLRLVVPKVPGAPRLVASNLSTARRPANLTAGQRR